MTPRTAACQAPLSMGFPRKNAGVGSHFFLQGIFLTQGSNLGVMLCRQILHHLSHQVSLMFLPYKIRPENQAQFLGSSPVLAQHMKAWPSQQPSNRWWLGEDQGREGTGEEIWALRKQSSLSKYHQQNEARHIQLTFSFYWRDANKGLGKGFSIYWIRVNSPWGFT